MMLPWGGSSVDKSAEFVQKSPERELLSSCEQDDDYNVSTASTCIVRVALRRGGPLEQLSSWTSAR